MDVPLTFRSALMMSAVAMTDRPEINRVIERLQMAELPIPRPQSGEVAIKLAAYSMHIDEIYAAQGTSLGRFFGHKRVSKDHPYIMGSSVSGTVVDLGTEATDFAIGDDVIVIPNHTGENGSWATYRCVSRSMVLRKSKELDHVQAAAITMASCVAWGAIENAEVVTEDQCLVVGASGGIGILLVQMLKSLGAHVTGVCSGANADFVLDQGADAVINYSQDNFGDAGEDAFDKVFDTLGGLDTERNAYRFLTKTGRFITIVGPVRHIGEKHLSWGKVGGVIAYILWRYCKTRFAGPRYVFGERLPRNTIRSALAHVVQQ